MHIRKQTGLEGATKPMLWMLLCAVFVTSSNVLAEDQEHDDSAGSTKSRAEHNEDDDNRPPVEIGSGGGIELEKHHRTEAEAQSSWHAHALWESRYVSEGRDNLSGDGLFSVSSEFAIDDVAFVPWLARSSAADLTELNLNFVYSTFIAQNLAASLGYTYLRNYYQDLYESDHEVGLDLGYQVLQHVTLSAVIYHSFLTDGAFTEFAAGYYDRPSYDVHYSVRLMLGANAGYIPDGHKGLNHCQLLGSVSYIPFIRLELYATAGYNQAISRDEVQYAGDETLGDFFWGGVGLVYVF